MMTDDYYVEIGDSPFNSHRISREENVVEVIFHVLINPLAQTNTVEPLGVSAPPDSSAVLWTWSSHD
jgi:hypothetical protein